MTSQISPFVRRIRRYWHEYGGYKGTIFSPLFIFSMLMSLASYSWWIFDEWRTLALSLIPSLLGFSLGTYAILFSLMTNRLKKSLRAVSNERGVPFLKEINATFFHFIFVQVIALFWAISSKSTLIFDALSLVYDQSYIRKALVGPSMISGFIGIFLTLYSVSLIVGAAMVVYRIASIVDPGED